MEEIIVRIAARHKGLVQAVKALVEHVTAFEREAPRQRTVDY